MHASNSESDGSDQQPIEARPNGSIRIAQFGPFELRLDTGELRKHGIRIRMQAKPLAVLSALLEKPGNVVTREELRYRLWPADTFVDFESGLNTAANRLRIGLGDSADMPRYVETLPRLGYRFMAPVTLLDTAPPERPAVSVAASNGHGSGTHTVVQVAPVEPVVVAPQPAAAPASRTAMIVAATAVVAALSFIAFRALPLLRRAPRTPEFHQLTFQNGWVGSARFGPNSDTVVYSRWLGGAPELDVIDTSSPESRRLSLPRGGLASVSRSGELAIVTMGEAVLPSDRAMLSRVPLNGGSPRLIARGVSGADWSPDGENLAVLIGRENGSTIEYPMGHKLYQTPALLTMIRVSPTGDYVAFLEHPLRQDDAGVVRVVDMKGNAKTLTRHWASVRGLAWGPSGRELWFTASETGVDRALRTVTLDGQDRVIARAPGVLRLLDVARNGRVLLARDDAQTTMVGRLLGQTGEQDLSWFDSSHIEDISDDGNLVLFTEAGEASGSHYWVYVHNQKTDSTTRIGTGRALSLSPDKSKALALDLDDRRYLSVLPLGAGNSWRIYGEGLEYQWARFMPDGRTLLAAGSYANQPMALYRQSVYGGKPELLRTGSYLDSGVVAPDGVHIAGMTPARRSVILTIGSNDVKMLPVDASLFPAGWSADSQSLYMANMESPPVKLIRVNVQSGRYEAVRTLTPSNDIGVTAVSALSVTPDGEHYVYSFDRLLSHVYFLDPVSG